MIISLYAGGMTVRDISNHVEATLGTELSCDTISNISDAVAEEILTWQQRPLDALYPVIHLDTIIVKVRDGAHVTNRAAHIAVGVDIDGVKHVLGIWLQTTEVVKFWAGVCADLSNRGIRDVLIVSAGHKADSASSCAHLFGSPVCCIRGLVFVFPKARSCGLRRPDSASIGTTPTV